MRAGLAFVLALAVEAAFAVDAAAQGERERRLAAELVVIAGDLRRLEDPAEPELRREGLRARLAGALASLPLMLRRAGADAGSVPALRDALERRDWRALGAGVEKLRERHPFDARALLPPEAAPDRLRLGAAIHRQACAGCHDAPRVDTLLPAIDLFEMAKRMPREEFAARLLLGVRGDRGTAWRNPFGDPEIGAMAACYLAGRTCSGEARAAAGPVTASRATSGR